MSVRQNNDPPRGRTVFKAANAFWIGLAKIGLTPAAVLSQARLPLTIYDGKKNRVTTAQFFALWRAVGELCADPAAGLKNRHSDRRWQSATINYGGLLRPRLQIKVSCWVCGSLMREVSKRRRYSGAKIALAAPRKSWARFPCFYGIVSACL